MNHHQDHRSQFDRRRCVTWVWRSAFLLLWLLFVMKTVEDANSPGLNFAPFVYPWRDVIRTCAILAIETVLLYSLLQQNIQLNRILVSLGVFAGLWLWEATYMGTDSPGWYYVNFDFLTLVLMGLLVITVVVGVRKWLSPPVCKMTTGDNSRTS